MLTAEGMFVDLSSSISGYVEEKHGTAGAGEWREDPDTLDVFVESKRHLDLPPLYREQRASMLALLGNDPKRIFEEPGAVEDVPLGWHRRKSTNVRGVAWHADTLYVEYRDRTVYRYAAVSKDTFTLLLEARSLGRAIAAVVKGNHEYEKLEEKADELRIAADWDGRLYQAAVLLWGKGSGKDYLSSIVIAYLVYVLLCLRDPQSYLELAPGEHIDVVNVAYNADQAKRVFFAKLKERLKRWKWLSDNYNVFESGKRLNKHVVGRGEVEINDEHVLFPRNIRCFSRHAQNESYEGLNVIAWVMDEASAFLSALKRENAEKIYATLRTSAATRFGRRWLGLIISYPRHGDDFTMTKHAEAVRDPTLGMYASGPFKTWEVNERLGRQGMVEVRPGHRVPVELANDYKLLGFEDAMARFECEPPSAVDALFKFPERLWQSVSKGRKSLIQWHPTVTSREVGGPDGTTRVRQFVGVKVTSWGKRLPRGTRMFFHGDPALTTDSFALAVGHGVPATIIVHVPASEVLTPQQVAENGLEPEQLVPWERDVVRTVIDALLVWRPDPKRDRQVDLLNVKETLLELRKHHRIEMGTFDNWGNFDTVQALQRLKMNVENEAWSGPFQLSMFTNARSAVYNDLVTLPDDPTITSKDPTAPGALYELERVQLIEARKIDHPEGGSKDLADAVVRVIKHVTELGQRGGLSFGTVYGHSEAYTQHAGYHPTTRKIEDPGKTPTPVTEHLREKDRQDREQRPPGEVTPGDRPAGTRRVTPDEAREIAERAAAAKPGPVKLGYGSVVR